MRKDSELQQQILNALDNNPMHFGKLADTLQVKGNKEAYLYLLDQVSEMQRGGKKVKRNTPPVLMTALSVRLGEELVYPIYRQDQEKKMIEEGKLSGEIVTDLSSNLGLIRRKDIRSLLEEVKKR